MLQKQDVAHFARGLLMGAADIVPGVSGGTIALIVGIYTRLVTAISRFDVTTGRLATQGRFLAACERVDARFLAALAAGIVTAILSMSSLIHFLLEHHRERTYAAFFGMILGSTILVVGMIPRWTAGRIFAFVVGTVAAFMFVGLPQLQNPPQFEPFYLFVCGSFAICAMILPGVSGSFLLLILGAYIQALALLSRLKGLSLSVNDILCIAALGGGIVCGLLSFAKLLRWLLARFEAVTLAVLGGFMVGSLRRLWPFQRDLTPEASFEQKVLEPIWPDLASMANWWTLLLMVTGCGLILVLEFIAIRHAEQGPVPPSPAESAHPIEERVS